MQIQTNLNKNDILHDKQSTLFEFEVLDIKPVVSKCKNPQTHKKNIQINKNDHFYLHNRRYIGNKYRLRDWIFTIITEECHFADSFADIFSGTGVISATASIYYKKVIVNDFLFSNFAIYKAFFDIGKWDSNKIESILNNYNHLNVDLLEDNYFSINFGDKYFSKNSSKLIGFVREDIERNKNNLTEKEYYILIASLLYSIDKVANTVGHYETFFKKNNFSNTFRLRPIRPIQTNNISIFREDSNLLAKKIEADITYIDPPYNSRQYSRFYHVLETLTKWDKPLLYGTALKPKEENMSDYCKVKARDKLAELVNDLKSKYLVVSYNNTYKSKSSSSKNKITLEEIEHILKAKGETKIFEKEYRHFNAGNTDFKNHKEYLFITKIIHD